MARTISGGVLAAQGARSAGDVTGVCSGVGPRLRSLLGDMLDQWRGLDRRVAALEDEFAAMARNDPGTVRNFVRGWA